MVPPCREGGWEIRTTHARLEKHKTPPQREGDWEITVTHAFLGNRPRARRCPASRVTASGVPWSPRMRKCADLEEGDG